MSYHVETTARFDKEFKKLDKYTQQIIKSWIVKNLQNCEDPRTHGKGLTAHKCLRLCLRHLLRMKMGNGGIESESVVYSVLYKMKS